MDLCIADTLDVIVSVYICGDFDEDCLKYILDIVSLINNIYKEGPDPIDFLFGGLGDVNCDDAKNILDVVLLINYKYNNSSPPDCECD